MTKEEVIQKADELYELCKEMQKPCSIVLGVEKGEIISSTVNEVEEGFLGGGDLALITQIKSFRGKGLSDDEILRYFEAFLTVLK